jgi:dTDP-4-dehydrorhamnose 3,5-epimerase-like enzyme
MSVSFCILLLYQQQDDRGSIHRLRVGGTRINLSFSKEGVMRSGYCHPKVKHVHVISGQVEVWLLGTNGTIKKVFNAFDYFQVPPL